MPTFFNFAQPLKFETLSGPPYEWSSNALAETERFATHMLARSGRYWPIQRAIIFSNSRTAHTTALVLHIRALHYATVTVGLAAVSYFATHRISRTITSLMLGVYGMTREPIPVGKRAAFVFPLRSEVQVETNTMGYRMEQYADKYKRSSIAVHNNATHIKRRYIDYRYDLPNRGHSDLIELDSQEQIYR